MNHLYVTMLIVVFVICGTLILHKDYDDGVVGKFGLGFMGLAAAIVALDTIASGVEYTPLKVNVLFVSGVTIFMLRYIYRWSRWRCTSKCNWKSATAIGDKP